VESARWTRGLAALLALVALAGCATTGTQPEETAPPSRPVVEEPPPVERGETFPDGLDIASLTLDQLNAEVQRRGLLRDIHFDFDRYELRPGDRAILRENAAFLKRHPTLQILIEGHCDERGTVEYNLALGDKRASASEWYLMRAGVVSTRMASVSYGKERPLDPRHEEEAWAKNRRAHFRIVAK
jgi:peptidoglycan-associated lipoprotein